MSLRNLSLFVSALLLVSLMGCKSNEPDYGTQRYPVNLDSRPGGAELYVLERKVWEKLSNERTQVPARSVVEANAVKPKTDGVSSPGPWTAPATGIVLSAKPLVLVAFWGDEVRIKDFKPEKKSENITVEKR